MCCRYTKLVYKRQITGFPYARFRRIQAELQAWPDLPCDSLFLMPNPNCTGDVARHSGFYGLPDI